MTLRLALILVAGAGIVGNSVLLAIGFGVRWRRTEPAWLRPWFPRSLVRDWRSLSTRYLLWWASWPHLVERLLPPLRAPLMATPSVVVWRSGRATLSRFGVPGVRPTGDAVLIVHSVVTRPWILDLLPGRSLVGGLVEAGFDVYLLDWGDPGSSDAMQGLTEHAGVLGLASVAVAQRAPGGRVHVVGYCMGATIALAAAGAWGTGPMASLTLVAPPYDTQVPGGTGELLRAPGLMPVLALDGQSLVPEAYIRESVPPAAAQGAQGLGRAAREAQGPRVPDGRGRAVAVGVAAAQAARSAVVRRGRPVPRERDAARHAAHRRPAGAARPDHGADAGHGYRQGPHRADRVVARADPRDPARAGRARAGRARVDAHGARGAVGDDPGHRVVHQRRVRAATCAARRSRAEAGAQAEAAQGGTAHGGTAPRGSK